MAKKHRKNLQQLIKKRQLLEQVSHQAVEPAVTVAAPMPTRATPSDVEPARIPSRSHAREIGHTLISLAIILGVFAVTIYLDQRTLYLARLGDWLYQAFRLNS